MWYRVGQVSGSSVSWGLSQNYDNYGFNPSVALYGTTVVEVHNGSGVTGPMWYRVGQLNLAARTISWGPSYNYDASGTNPTVAITSCATASNPTCGLIAVEVHNGSGVAGPMWYRVGVVNPDTRTISWGDSHKYDDFGMNPSLGVQPCYTSTNGGQSCGITVVEVHNGSQGFGLMWYRVGNLSGGTEINWGDSYPCDSGWNPKVTLWGSTLIEVHNGTRDTGPMWFHTGSFYGGTTVTWDPSHQYFPSGYNPSVALNGFVGVGVFNGSATAGPMGYQVVDVR
jgi:hypothetical protein